MAEKYRIVIADDEALICMDLREMLEEAGHTVVGVGSDGVEALDLVKEKAGSRHPRCENAAP